MTGLEIPRRSSKDHRILYGSIFDSRGNEALRVEVEDLGEDWLFHFGIDGDNIGLYIVVVNKMSVAEQNLFGALATALNKMDRAKKRAENAGKVMNEYA